MNKSTKILLTLFIGVPILIISLLFIVNQMSNPEITQADTCFNTEADAQENLTEKLNAINSQTERLQVFCKDDKESFDNLISCLEKVSKDNSLSTDLSKAFPDAQATIAETISSHNEVCPDTPISLP